MLYQISNISIILFEMLCCKIFFETFAKSKKKNNKTTIIQMIMLVGFSYLIVILFSKNVIIKELCIVVTVALIMRLFYEISLIRAFAYTFLYQSIVILIDFVVYIRISNLFYSVDNAGKIDFVESSLIIAFGKLLLFICVVVISKIFKQKNTGGLSSLDWIKLLIIPAITSSMLIAMVRMFRYIENQRQADILYSTALGMIGMNFFVFYLLNGIVEKKEIEHENQVYEIKLKNQIQIYNSFQENYNKQQSRAHEFENHIMCIYTLIKNRRFNELEKYIEDISHRENADRAVISTNNALVDAVLNTKYAECMDKKIVFIIKVNDLSGSSVNNEDLVILLSNLLNNAIESCERCINKKSIRVKIIIENNELVISVRNTKEHSLIKENNIIKTTKQQKPFEHGFGIQNIEKIIEKYKGEYIIDDTNDEFYFSIIIPCNMAEYKR